MKVSKSLWDNDGDTQQYGRKIVVIIHIYVARAIFLLFYDNKDTKSESRLIEFGLAGPIFTNKNIKVLMRH